MKSQMYKLRIFDLKLTQLPTLTLILTLPNRAVHFTKSIDRRITHKSYIDN